MLFAVLVMMPLGVWAGVLTAGLPGFLVMVLPWSRRVTRPLTAMQAATHRVAEGDLRGELGPTGTQELDDLASDFNLDLHERWTSTEVAAFLTAVEKVEAAYARG